LVKEGFWSVHYASEVGEGFGAIVKTCAWDGRGFDQARNGGVI
jgi:hypothetical protein